MKKLILSLMLFVSTLVGAQTFPVNNLQVNGTSSFAGTMSGIGLTNYFQANGYINVKQFGATGNGITNDYAAIISAQNYAALTCSTLYFPSGTYALGTNTWTLANCVQYQGTGQNGNGSAGSVITYTGTGNAIQINNPINSSTYSGIGFKNLTVNGLSMSSGKALFYDTGSSYLRIDGCEFNVGGSGSYGIVFDQTEVSSVTNTTVQALANVGSGAMIWISNGATPQNPTGQTYFTNSIVLSGDQINPALGGTSAVGILDSGGVSHIIQNNNINGGNYGVQVITGQNIAIKNNEIEGNTTAGIGFTSASQGAIGIDISNNAYGGGSTPFINLASGAIDRLTYQNNSIGQSVTNANAEVGLLAGVSGKLLATQNRQLGVGKTPYNNYLANDVSSVGTVTVSGSTTAGANTYSSNLITWRYIGDVCFFNINIQMTAKDAAMAGNVLIGPLPVPSKTSSNGQTAFSPGGINNITLDSGYNQFSTLLINGQSYIFLQEMKSNGALANITAANISATSSINISGIYAF